MRGFGRLVAAATVAAGSMVGAAAGGTGDAEDVVARHMVGEALLAAHLVAIAERAGMGPAEINAILKDVAKRSGIDEFWITDERGRAYLTNQDFAFTFDLDPAKQPQPSAFWPLLEGKAEVVIQDARQREVDDRVFKYVGVAGVDKPRIVQVGVSQENLPQDE